MFVPALGFGEEIINHNILEYLRTTVDKIKMDPLLKISCNKIKF